MAGRIPQTFIDDLLARVNIIDVLDGRVQKLKRAGKNYSGLCPFHKEKTPSFSANQEKQFYYCFGCGAGGNALGFLMEYENIGFPEAVEELAKSAGMEVPRDDSPQQREKDQQLKKLYELLDAASQYYEDQLRSNDSRTDAVNYLKSRGLSGQAAKAFSIGFAPSGWDNLLKHLGKDDPHKAKLLEEAGMLIHNEERDSRYDRFRNRIMFPIRDQRGRTIAFGGRVLGDDKPKYLNSPETPTFHKSRELYGLYEARKHNSKLDRLIIVEGYMDVVGLAQYGIHYAVATLGTATTEQHLERLFKIVPEIIFCFDGDNAGREAAMRALKTAIPVIEDGKEARFLFLPDGEDPDSLVRQEGEIAFSERLSTAQPLSEFFFKSHSETADLDSMDGRARFSTEVLPAINSMRPSLLQQMMLDRICELTNLSLDQIQTTVNFHEALTTTSTPASQNTSTSDAYSPPPALEYDNYPSEEPHYADFESGYQESYQEQPSKKKGKFKNGYKKDKFGEQPGPRLPRPKNTELSFAEKLISLLLHYPQLASEYTPPQSLSQAESTDIQLLIQLITYYTENPSASLGQLAVDWREDEKLSQTIISLYEISTSLEIHSEEDARLYLKDAKNQLELIALEQEISALQRKQQQTGKLSTEEKVSLAQNFQKLNQLKHITKE
ncbi:MULTISPECIES: DNA primase [unclassified Neptuniibacter]|uniref:DNA primase n=1 Tax=unclassified Neptuniibacter TaxID=2630693 RepID=UPI000C666418|nr:MULTISPECIES: DNA primase [unclassified Neptuniibacter]MAY42215.1 DNA primase [Oceanospirillaceae bacterium]|tara:strand:- start:4081 stop:6078 length:1998 start_codon:yes stop_codon:yes gene_type:complete